VKEYKLGDFKMIDTEQSLIEWAFWLEKSGYRQVGVDLENHHIKSYNGFLCLIQITTPGYETFLIDAVKLKDSIMPILGPSVFENPKI
jgi:ribonuclease D